MRSLAKSIVFLAIAITVIMAGNSPAHGQIVPGHKAPIFELKDIEGERYSLAEMERHPMVILYFFDVASKSSREGLRTLNNLAKLYVDADLKVWAITPSAKNEVMDFVSESRIDHPCLLATAEVSDLYQARKILPTICILGPQLQILNYIQGGGKSTEIMLVEMAEKELQRKQLERAKAFCETVSRRNPQNVEAEMIKGYAELKGGDVDAAEKTFRALSQSEGLAKVVGLEGLVSVHAARGDTDAALKLAEKVEKMAPDRGYVNVVKADIFYSQGKKDQAQAELQKFLRKKSTTSFQMSEGLKKIGQLQAEKGNFNKADKFYNQAEAAAPFNIDVKVNLGRIFEKEGKWDKALTAYRQALVIRKDDVFAAALAKRAQRMVALRSDSQKKKDMDELVQRLAERFRKQQKSIFSKEEDTWTSRPLILTFVDLKEKGGLPDRDGFASVLMLELSEQLNASGRIQVVERELMERLLEELNLGTTELVDPDTALRLGKILAAKIIGTGALYFMPASTMLSLRLIDTETAGLPKVINRQFDRRTSLDSELNNINDEIQKALVQKYPLQGFVVQASQDRILINLGSKQGVHKETQFEVLKEQEPIKYKGKILHPPPKIIAQLQVDQVDQDLCYARILDKQGSIARDDKVREKP